VHRKDIQTLADELAQSEKRNKEAKDTIRDLRREIARLEKELKAQEEQMEREKKVTEAAAKSVVMSVQSDCVTKLNEQKSQWYKEKRELLGFAAHAFKQFFHLQNVIDESAFKRIVNRAKEELALLTELNTAVRRIVGAASNQRTDEAVYQAVRGRA